MAVLLTVGSCGDDNKKTEDLPFDVKCPRAGSSCSNTEGPLYVGAAKYDITPEIRETFRDCGFDGLCPEDPGYPGPDQGEGNAEFDGHPAIVDGPEAVFDANGNGIFEPVWIAGFGNARPALGVHDPLWSRVIVIRQGDTTYAHVALDLVGYFYEQVKIIRERVRQSVAVDLVLVSASHTHQGPDTIGIWGYDEGTTGVDSSYMEFVIEKTVQAIEEAATAAVPATMQVAAGFSGRHPNAAVQEARGINNLIWDQRDPVIIDDQMRVIRFARTVDDAPIATMINWQNHPEAMCSDNLYLSSDFVHYLREAVEGGIDRDGVQVPGLGGMAFYVNGAVGGMQSPLRTEVVDLDGVTQFSRHCERPTDVNHWFFNKSRAIGDLAGYNALKIFEESAELVSEPRMSFATKSFKVKIENWGYHAMFLTGVFYQRELSDFDRQARITEDNLPSLETEVAVFNLGPVQAIAVPGELFPEYFLGGYDGSRTGSLQQIVTVQENPPDLTYAPEGPYLRDHMTRDVRMVFGLTPDELGYIIPPFNYELHDRVPYIEEAPGHHYEETNAIGKTVGPTVETMLLQLLGEVP